MKIYTQYLLTVSLVVLSANAAAQDLGVANNSFRVDLSVNNTALVMEANGESISTSTSSSEGALTFQSHTGFYGQLGFSKSNLYKAESAYETIALDEDYSASMFGFGYRTAQVNSPDKYWGIGYRNTKLSDSPDTAHGVSTFWEKDNAKRYGVIDLSYSSDDVSRMLGISGRHIWFVSSSLGLGVNWGLGSGAVDLGPDYELISTGAANVGAVIMFRPKL